jgi:hypothetical protein
MLRSENTTRFVASNYLELTVSTLQSDSGTPKPKKNLVSVFVPSATFNDDSLYLKIHARSHTIWSPLSPRARRTQNLNNILDEIYNVVPLVHWLAD